MGAGAISFHNLVMPAPPAELTPSFEGACVNLSAASPFAEHVRWSSWLALEAHSALRAPPPEWSRPADDAALVDAINAERGLAWSARHG